MNVDRFLAWADKRNIVSVRSATLYITIWMTWRVTVWAFSFADAWMGSGKAGMEAAAVVAAVTAPFTLLQGWVFKNYMDAK